MRSGQRNDNRPPSAYKRRLVEAGFATPTEVARHLGISRWWVYQLINGGVLSSIQHGRRFSVPWNSVHQYAATRVKQGKVA